MLVLPPQAYAGASLLAAARIASKYFDCLFMEMSAPEINSSEIITSVAGLLPNAKSRVAMVAPSTLAWKLTLLFGMLGTGAINTLSKKIQNQCVSAGIDGKIESFSKPWSQTLVMFSGEACLIFVFFIQQRLQRLAHRKRPDIQILDPRDLSFSSSIDDSLHPKSLNSTHEDEMRKPLLPSINAQVVDEKKEEPTWKT